MKIATVSGAGMKTSTEKLGRSVFGISTLILVLAASSSFANHAEITGDGEFYNPEVSDSGRPLVAETEQVTDRKPVAHPAKKAENPLNRRINWVIRQTQRLMQEVPSLAQSLNQGPARYLRKLRRRLPEIRNEISTIQDELQSIWAALPAPEKKDKKIIATFKDLDGALRSLARQVPQEKQLESSINRVAMSETFQLALSLGFSPGPGGMALASSVLSPPQARGGGFFPPYMRRQSPYPPPYGPYNTYPQPYGPYNNNYPAQRMNRMVRR